MKTRIRCVALLLGLVTTTLADSGKGNGFQLELLPRAFQKNPLVDVNVITEMTTAGRLRERPTSAAPQYYLASAGRIVELGSGVVSNAKPPAVEDLTTLMEKSLAVSHYRPAPEGTAPSIVITFSWGTYAAPAGDEDPEVSTVANETRVRELVERARLIGGDKFANELVAALNEESKHRRAMAQPRNDETGAVPAQKNVMGSVTLGMAQMFSPLERFRSRNAITRNLLEDSGGSIYFVVASAYDAASVAANKRVLLWRTKMTTRADGVSLNESIPVIVATAGPYFGREMDHAESLRRRLTQEGTVELGPLEVKEFK